jgi:hypothetical protein
MLTIIKKNDTYDVIEYQLENEDGTIADLTGASVNFVMGKKNKLITNSSANITSAINGIVQYQLTEIDTLVSGTFLGEFVVTFANGKVKTYPSNGYITVDIEQNLDTSQNNIVLDMIAEKQGEFTDKLNSILQQAGNVNMSYVNEYNWMSTDGQVTYVFPSTANYTAASAKWFQVFVGNVFVDNSLVNRIYDDQFTLSIDPSRITDGVTVTARWIEPIAPIVPSSYKIIPQQPLPPVDAEEGDLWFDTSDDTYQGTVFDGLNTRVTSAETSLADRASFVSIKSYSNLKVLIAEGYDWSPAIAQAITDAQSTNKKIVLHADEDMYITQPIVPSATTKIVGFGKYNSKLKLKGAIKGIDLSSTAAKTGVEISSISIEGTGTTGQIGIDAYYLVNGSSIKDIRIENVDVGIQVKKCWYGAFSEIYIKTGLTYGLHVISASSSEQVNAISFKSVFINGCNNAVFLDGINVAAAIQFDSCTFEQSKKTAVISNGFSPLKFVNCYFEGNYKDAITTNTLTWQTPIDVKVTGTSVRNLVKFDSCYFARSNNFLTSSQKTSIYLGTDIKGTFDNCQFVCNTGGYIESNIYSDSQYPASIRNVSEDGFATNMYTGVLKEEVIFCDPDYNLRFTSTINNAFGVIVKDAGYYVKFIPRTTGTVAEQATIKLQMLSDNTVIGPVITFPTSFTKDTPIEFNMGRITPTKALNLVGYTATTTDLIGMLYLVRKYYD